MKKHLFSLAAMAMMSVSVPVLAQNGGEGDIETPYMPTVETGYYRIVNNGYGDVLTVDKQYGLNLNATENSARTMPGSVFYYDTDGMANFAQDMEQFRGDDGEIHITLQELQELMATTAWKSGSYHTYDLSSQSVSLGNYMQDLSKYVYAALDNFHLSDEVKDFYENGPRMELVAFMYGVFYPQDVASLDNFREAVQRFMARWKHFFDMNIYVKGVQNTEHGFLLHFHSPLDICKIEDTQETFNQLTDGDTGEPLGYNYDFFGCIKRKVIEEAAKELDGEALAYVKRVLEPIEMNREYYIGENEQGELYVVGFTSEDMLGLTEAWANTNQDELIWNFVPVDSESPLLVPMQSELKDAEGYYYTTMFTDFAYQLGEGVEALYISAVENGLAKLEPVVGKVPANTGVILRSKSAAAVANVLLPIDEQLAAIEGNLLKGTCLPMDGEGKCALGGFGNPNVGWNIAMCEQMETIAANSCYTEEQAVFASMPDGIKATLNSQLSTLNYYDLQGRRVTAPAKKGVYVVNGKKVVK